MQEAIDLFNWVRYMCQIVVDGDYANKWLLEMPADVVESVFIVGKWVAGLVGW